MNARTLHLTAITAKLLSAVLAIVATAVFCYCLLDRSAVPGEQAPAPLMPAPTVEYPPAH